jgi:hypothetical protein
VAIGLERFRVARRETSHKRHVRKYATGKLAERWFHSAPAGQARSGGAECRDVLDAGQGSRRGYLTYHSATARSHAGCARQIKDEELADEIAALENSGDAAETRRVALDAIARRYTPVATADAKL